MSKCLVKGYIYAVVPLLKLKAYIFFTIIINLKLSDFNHIRFGCQRGVTDISFIWKYHSSLYRLLGWWHLTRGFTPFVMMKMIILQSFWMKLFRIIDNYFGMEKERDEVMLVLCSSHQRKHRQSTYYTQCFQDHKNYLFEIKSFQVWRFPVNLQFDREIDEIGLLRAQDLLA